MTARSSLLILFLPLLFAACGDLPEPFLGNPGATARKLAQPPTARLAVPPPADALLPDDATQLFAAALARAKGHNPDHPRGLSKVTLAR